MKNIIKSNLKAVVLMAICSLSYAEPSFHPTGPCANGNCGNPVWELKHSEHDINLQDNHGNQVLCRTMEHDNKQYSWWVNDKKFTLINHGLEDNKPKTCFATTQTMNELLNTHHFIDNFPHGYLQAKFTFQHSGNLDASWPAFWLDGTDNTHPWPSGGEIDIAEQYQGVNYTHLIGNARPCRGIKDDVKRRDCYFDDGRNMQTVTKFSPYPNNNTDITYGMEWSFDKYSKKLKLCTWENKSRLGCATIDQNDEDYNHALRSVYDNFISGNMRIIFDVNYMSGSNPNIDVNSSLTVTNVAIFKIP